MASILPVFLVLVIIAALMTAAALFVPKGPNHTSVTTFSALPTTNFDNALNRVIRTGLMIALAACYLMWMVTYMAQLHPLVCESR